MGQDDAGRTPPPRASGRIRRGAKRILMPVVAVVATLYFLIDGLFLWFLRPIADRIGRQRILEGLRAWVRSLGPYPMLALFLVPLVILEPVKPVAFYLLASGHVLAGPLLLVIGELLKITLVERLFRLGKDKLMSIAAFAWAYGFVMKWLGYLQALPPWQAVLRRYLVIKARARTIAMAVEDRARRIVADIRRRWTAFWADVA
jgi:hypothetical protein